MINMSFVLLYRVVKLVLYLSVLKNLRPLLLIFVAVNITRIIFGFNNENSATVYDDVIYLAGFAVFCQQNKIVYGVLGVGCG